jgi:hypothetical protein
MEEFGLIEIKLSGLIEYGDSQTLIFFLKLEVGFTNLSIFL